MAPEDEAGSGPETTPEPVSSPTTPPKKAKRLTLQERLAAAAKAKRKKSEQTAVKSGETETKAIPEDAECNVDISESIAKSEVSETPEIIDTVPTDLNVNSEPNSEVPTEVEIIAESGKKPANEDESLLDEDNAEAPPQIDTDSAQIEVSETAEPDASSDTPELAARDAEISNLKSETEALRQKIAEQEKQLRQSIKRAPPSQESDKRLAEKDKLLAQTEKKLLNKEETIKQLMEEGQELSKKELKLNERIRSLVANNTKLESSLKSYAEKNEESLLRLGEIEDLVKVHKLQSVSQLFDVISTSNQKASDLQAALDKEKNSNWEGKHKEIQRLYEKELDEKKECKKQLNEMTVQLELLQNQTRLELQSKTDIIEQLNREIMSSKDESSVEVLRLEAKIEDLRMENENVLRTSQDLANNAENEPAAPKKVVDYVDFAKLSETHQNLQAQYVSSQENWKLIESNLHSKIETLTEAVENAKKAKIKTTAEVKKLHSRLNSQLDEIDKLKSELVLFAEDKNDCEFRFQMKANECAELEDKIEELRTVFNSDRKNYDVKIKNLTDSVHDLQAQTPTFTPSVSFDNLSSIQGRRGVRDSGLHISMDHSRQPMNRKFSANSIASSAINTPGQHWEETSFASEGPDGIYENHNISSFSFTEEIYPLEAPEPGDTPMTMNAGTSSAGATKNIQIINKMSATIRRLEADVAIMKEENDQLAAEKENAQQEILKRLAVDDKLEVLEKRIETLHENLAEKSRKEETLLEVIGEKSERVGELEADVDDLKDLLRSQVQQMIEMQSK